MSINRRLKQVETISNRAVNRRFKSMSDDELRRIADSGSGSDDYGDWLKTLTDEEVKIIADGLPGAKRLEERFNEYQKPHQKN